MKFIQKTNRIGPAATRKMAQLRKIPPEAYKYFKGVTPIKTGNARRNTNYTNKPNGGTIRGDYPYANRLNEGYSNQAKEGMTTPTIKEIRKLVRRVL